MSQISRLQRYELFLTPTIPYKKYLAYHSDVVSDTMNYLNTLYRNNVFRDAEYATDSTMTMIKKNRQLFNCLSKRLWNCANYTRPLHRVSVRFFQLYNLKPQKYRSYTVGSAQNLLFP